MHALASLIFLDLRGVLRDNVMLFNIGVSFIGMVVLTVIGHFQGADPAWTRWFPLIVILALMTNPAAYGFQFGLLIVDERETNVSSALAVSPVRPHTMLLVRTLLLSAWLIAWPLITIYVMNATWRALPISAAELLAVTISLTFLGPLTSLGIGAYAANKVEAIALFKGLNFVVLAPAVLAFMPADGVFRYLFALSPSGPGYLAFDAFANGRAQEGYLFSTLGVAYNAALLALAVRTYLHTVYKTSP